MTKCQINHEWFESACQRFVLRYFQTVMQNSPGLGISPGAQNSATTQVTALQGIDYIIPVVPAFAMTDELTQLDIEPHLGKQKQDDLNVNMRNGSFTLDECT